jgi:hypothetical protein
VGPLGVHCAQPGQPWPPTGQPHIQLLYFFNTTDVNSTVPDFTGTETLIRVDLYQGQPCPTEPGPNGGYTYLPDIGIPLDYYGCHRRTPYGQLGGEAARLRVASPASRLSHQASSSS